jgi:hypothetical protein
VVAQALSVYARMVGAGSPRPALSQAERVVAVGAGGA